MTKHFHLIALIILFIGLTTQAQESIKCIGKKSGIIAIENQSEILQDARIKLFDLDQSVVYLTHKKDFYSLEMFIPSLEQRIYSEGAITEKQPLTLVSWTREQLLEIRCENSTSGDVH